MVADRLSAEEYNGGLRNGKIYRFTVQIVQKRKPGGLQFTGSQRVEHD